MSSLYKVERIVGKRIRDAKHVQYKVKWQGYSSSQNTWEPLKNLRNVQELVDDFEDRNKEKLMKTIALNPTEQKSHSFATKLKNKIQEVHDKKDPAKIAQTSQPRTTRQRAANSPGKTQPHISVEKKTASKTYKHNKNGVGRPKKKKEIEDLDFEQVVKEIEERPKIASPKSAQNTSIEATSEDGDILEGKLSLLADKIKATVERKKRQKNLKIVDCYRKGPKRSVFYVLENENGERKEQSRNFIVENIPHIALDYYERLLETKEENLQKSSNMVQ